MAEDENFLGMTEQECERKMPEYVELQEIAQSVLFERLKDKHIRMIRCAGVVKKMLYILDSRYRVTSTIGLAVAQSEFQALRYHDSDDMEKFIDLFNTKAEIYDEAGGHLTDDAKVTQLAVALSDKFDSCIDWYDNQDQEERSFDEVTKRVIEKATR